MSRNSKIETMIEELNQMTLQEINRGQAQDLAAALDRSKKGLDF
jgi:hypothetical protein